MAAYDDRAPEEGAFPGWSGPGWSGYGPALRRFFGRRAPPEEVDDLVQEVLLALYARRDPKPVLNAEACLFTVARNVLLRHHRHQGPSNVVLLEEALRDEPAIWSMGGDARRFFLFRFPWLAVAIAASIVAAVGFPFVYSFVRPKPTPPGEAYFASAVGQQKTIVLQDGTRILLDAALEIRVSFGESTRQIYLDRGRALFAVQKNPSRPFKVDVDNKQITALGTQFVVERENKGLSVSLLEGRLLIQAYHRQRPVQALEIRSGTRVQIGAQDVWRVTSNMATALAWTKGKVIFDDAPVRDVVDELTRYSPRRFEIDDDIAAKRITVVLNAGDIDTFVKAIAAMDFATVSERSDGTIILSKKRLGSR